MGKFKDDLVVDNKIMRKINAVQRVYDEKFIRFEFKDKIALAVFSAIQDIKTDSDSEELLKHEYMNGLNKVICNYEELQPVIESYLNDNRTMEK